MRIYRYVFALLPGWNRDQHAGNEEVITALGTLWPEELLHIHRLRGIMSATKLATNHVWALLQADQQRLSHIQEALEWVSKQTSMNVADPPEIMSIQSFINLADEQPQRARGLIRRAQYAALNQRVKDSGVRKWHLDFSAHLQTLGFTFPEEAIQVEDSQDEQEEGFMCPQCAAVLPHHIRLQRI